MHKLLLTAAIAVATTSTVLAADATGRWTTVNDQTGKPESVVEIRQGADGTLAGKVVEILRVDQGPNPVCASCTGANKNKPVKGLTILWGLKRDGNGRWSGGTVLDPESGQTYNAKVEVNQDGSKLKLRGYVGIEALGRTQTWKRK